MIFRAADTQDIAQIMTLIAQGVDSLRKQGSPQWQDGYEPSRQQVEQDIKAGAGYVLEDEKVVAYAALIKGTDPVYTAIKEGGWLGEGPYVSIHRVVVDKHKTGKGLAQKLLRHLIAVSQQLGYRDIRIDTYHLNIGMQKAIINAGFVYRGKVHFPIPYGDRWAYQYLIE
ncbi:N-acetyltransferase [Tetragenococcus halophilus subsp. flandriensis]|uniref:GNAT family N-acetyltransferase n=1 Tax=Tetragenococcus halophilus TaxID=51669 RepID=UPI0023E9D1D7|nr:GNAT family N-acetyltransferase [Tetragenococcus halophilus]GMA09458.1 N-acetyltransferase [Tetragenococcus halophilus subsp. flandriensis]